MVSLSLFWPGFLRVERSFSVSQSIWVPGIEQDTNFPWASCHTEEGMFTDPHVAEREGGREETQGEEKKRQREREGEIRPCQKSDDFANYKITCMLRVPWQEQRPEPWVQQTPACFGCNASAECVCRVGTCTSSQHAAERPGPRKSRRGGSRPALTISALEPYTISKMGKGSSMFTQQMWHKKTLLRPTETSLVFA